MCAMLLIPTRFISKMKFPIHVNSTQGGIMSKYLKYLGGSYYLWCRTDSLIDNYLIVPNLCKNMLLVTK